MKSYTRLFLVGIVAVELAHLQAQPRRFQADIERMLERDKTNLPPRDGILFIGSSIFRRWTQLAEQMSPLPVFNRAFGGSVTQDLLDRMDQLVLPNKPRIVVYYCGSNDVSAGESAEAIVGRTKQFLKIVGEKAPNTFVYYTSIQKAPEKRDRWNVVEAVNKEMERYSHEAKNLGYIDLNSVLFDRQGNLREDLFLPDKLHFRPESTAYTEFSQIVKPILTKAWVTRVDDARLRNAGKTGEEWLSYGVTPQETRYSPLNQINTDNVSRLGLAWSYDVGPGGGDQEATPLVWNGTIYGITNWSIVFAIDARTGKERWRWDPEVNQVAVRPKICCGVVNRGLAIYEDKIIAPVIDGRIEALDAETGKPVWEARVAYPQNNYTITMAPRIAKGKVIVGISGADYPVRGFFDAYDASMGRFAWRFYTIPGDPSKPPENAAMKKAAETWTRAGLESGAGGGSVWDSVTYDPEADLVYVGTGNAGPYPEEIRKSKGLDNLYVCSVLAVRPDTGELKWYFQMVPGDSWDYDSVQQLMLAELRIKGRQRKVLMQANKNGFYYVLDRVTGEFISGQPYAQVTWAKGLNERTGRPIVNAAAHYGADPIAISPSEGGAHNWSPMSFNPATGLVYIPSAVTGSTNFAVDQNFTYKPGENNGLARRGRRHAEATTLPAPPAIGPVPVEGQRGILLAWDPVNQKERWRANGGGSVGGGTVATGGNLVFQVINDGRFVAYSADKGEKLLEIETGLRGGMGPPITYQIDGKQYVSLMGGTGMGGMPKLLTFVIDAAPLP